MGVNIPNIKRVVIFGVPKNILSYPQAVERGKKDCSDVLFVLFYSAHHLCHCDPTMRAFVGMWKQFLMKNYPKERC